ncbi:MAG: histidine kinase dimerization/phosphoacceptor domain -containing protein [Armatimonadota bacterium]
MLDTQVDLSTLIAKVGEGALLHAVLGATEEAVILVDATQHILCWTAGATSLLGYAAQDIQGQPLSTCFPTPLPLALESSVCLTQCDGTQVAATVRQISLCPPGECAAGTLYILRRVEARPDQHTASPAEGNSHRSQRELNHYARNNLAIISALLEMEMLQAPDSERKRLMVSLARIRCLAFMYNLVMQDAGRIEVGMLARSVVDSVTTFFGKTSSALPVSCLTLAYLDARRATYFGLALTELAVYLFSCMAALGDSVNPSIVIEQLVGEIVVTFTSMCDTPTQQCPPLDSLSRDILTGLVQRSLGGQLMLQEAPTFTAVIRCSVTSHSE